MPRGVFKVGAALFCFLLAARSGAQEETQIIVKNPRPIYEIVLKLRRSYGWAVNYEEPRYVFRGEPNLESDGGRKLLAHGYRELILDLPPLENRREPSEDETLRRLVSAYNEKYGQEFELRRDDNRFSIVGINAKDQLGRYGSKQEAVLDTTVTLQAADRDGYAALRDLCASLTGKIGIRVVMGLGPFNSLRQVQTSRGFSGPARQVISELLNQTRDACRSGWSLLYSPSDDTFGLNIAVMRSSTDKPDPCSH